MGGTTDLIDMQRERTLAPTLVMAYVAGLARSVASGDDPTTAKSYDRDMESLLAAARELHCAAAALRGDNVLVGAEAAHSFSGTFGASRTLATMALQALGLTAKAKLAEAADSEMMAEALDELATKLDCFANGDGRQAGEIADVFSTMARLATKPR